MRGNVVKNKRQKREERAIYGKNKVLCFLECINTNIMEMADTKHVLG